jgi:hypothetical protein
MGRIGRLSDRGSAGPTRGSSPCPSPPAARPSLGRLLQRKPFLAREAVELVLSEITATQPRARDTKPDELMDMRFVRELDESGFIDRLYR